MIKRLNSMVGKELTKENLAHAILFDKPKLLKKQLEGHSSAVTCKVMQTPTGDWGRVDQAGSNISYRIGLKNNIVTHVEAI